MNGVKDCSPEVKYSLFVRYARNFINIFGLDDWHITFLEDKEIKDLAQCRHQSHLHNCTLVFNTAHPDVKDLNDSEIKKTALHEVCHILTADLYYYSNHKIDDDVITRVYETFAIRMTNALYDYLECE